METIKREELVEMIKEIKNATPITLILESDARLLKKDNPYVGTRVVKKINGMINFDYQTSVNNQRVRENTSDDFKSFERKWGKHITRAIIEHKQNYYLQVKLEKTLDVKYYHNQVEISYDMIKDYFPKSSYKSRQGVVKEIKVRDIKFENIKQININKKQYQVI